MQMHPSPPNRPDSASAMRGSTLGQMHYGQVKTHVSHPVLKAFIKTSIGLNALGWLVLFGMFRIQDMFPPHEAPFMSAIGWYFFFGGVYGLFSMMFFKFANYTEQQAITKALTQDRRYEWHSKYDTKSVTKENLAKAPEVKKQIAASEALSAGSNYFRITGFLALASAVTWLLGVWSFFGDFLSGGE